jgi:hypothetical protein
MRKRPSQLLMRIPKLRRPLKSKKLRKMMLKLRTKVRRRNPKRRRPRL